MVDGISILGFGSYMVEYIYMVYVVYDIYPYGKCGVIWLII